MAHLAFIAPPFAGHFNPMGALAAELAARGHRTSFIHMADAAALVRAPACFTAIGAATHPLGTLAGITARINALAWGAGNPLVALIGLRRLLRDLAAMTSMLCDHAPAVLRQAGTALIVADQTEAAGGLLARHLGLPYVSVANALPINPDPQVPPPFTGWPYDPSPAGIRRNQAGYWVSAKLSGTLDRLIARQARHWKLGPIGSLADCLSPTTQISQLAAALDFPRASLPAGFTYTGPLRALAPPIPDHSASDLPDGIDVFASLGTLQGGRAALFKAIATCCQARGLRLLIAHGGRLSEQAAARLPGSPHIRAFVDQAAVLRRVRLTITHGGLNTVLDSLGAGVPLIAIPLAFEQAAIGARLTYAGAGQVVSARHRPRALVHALGQAMDDLIGNPAYTMQARRLAEAIHATGGVRQAADIIDAVLNEPR